MKLELSKSILESISSRVNNDIFTFDDVESEYKFDNIQEKLYNRLYKKDRLYVNLSSYRYVMI